MSGCLICQRPDICSTTSLESIRTSTSAPCAVAAAARRPAISPEYSATLLVARPMLSLTSASTSPVPASSTTAPNPAGPGLPREPPSAATMRRPLTPGSQTPFGRADQDPAAPPAAPHLVVAPRPHPAPVHR